MPLTETEVFFTYEKSGLEILDKIANLRKCCLFLHGKHPSQTPASRKQLEIYRGS